jgi:hypothetical protein
MGLQWPASMGMQWPPATSDRIVKQPCTAHRYGWEIAERLSACEDTGVARFRFEWTCARSGSAGLVPDR